MTLYVLSGLAILCNACAASSVFEECSGEFCKVTSLIQTNLQLEAPHPASSSLIQNTQSEKSLGQVARTSSSMRRLYAVLETLATPPKLPSHPFPSLDWGEAKFPGVVICTIALFLAGVLCSAGGIGGGGVYVTVLMVAGQLSPHDAVPLSKAVVFCGSLASLVLNLRKSLAMKAASGGQAKTLIDYNICRLLVPSALFGTLLGVLLNQQIAPHLIVVILFVILVCMTWMSCKQFYKHYSEECCFQPGDDPNSAESPETTRPSPQEQSLTNKDVKQSASIRSILCNGEGVGAFALLLLVICCGVLRAHGLACQADHLQDVDGLYGRDACTRPVIRALFQNRLLTWMAPQSAISQVLLKGTVLLPMLICVSVVVSYSCYLILREQWKLKQVLLYCLVGVLTGSFAGLVGIGGGLVFSPFILMMTGDPTVAVATSSTCVIFTSSSTTFQYLFTDRITMSLTIIYGIVNILASYVGTSAVHMMDTLPNRKSLISGIVCGGVLTSVFLSVYKLCTMSA